MNVMYSVTRISKCRSEVGMRLLRAKQQVERQVAPSFLERMAHSHRRSFQEFAVKHVLRTHDRCGGEKVGSEFGDTQTLFRK